MTTTIIFLFIQGVQKLGGHAETEKSALKNNVNFSNIHVSKYAS